jgi:hypothetical protein
MPTCHEAINPTRTTKGDNHDVFKAKYDGGGGLDSKPLTPSSATGEMVCDA